MLLNIIDYVYKRNAIQQVRHLITKKNSFIIMKTSNDT